MPLYSLQLVKDRRRVEEYLQQSLPYLKDAQATLREVAVRFIGEPPPPGSLFRQPGPRPRCCTGSEGQLGSGRSDATLCSGLAVPHCRNQSKEKLSEICHGECGWGWRGRGRSLGRVLPCRALHHGNAFGQRSISGASQAFLTSSFQLICWSLLLLRARERDGWGWHSWRGCLGGLCRQGGLHLGSLSFCHSPPGPGGRQQTLHLLPGSSDDADPDISQEAALISVVPAALVLLALLNQAEVHLSWGKMNVLD